MEMSARQDARSRRILHGRHEFEKSGWVPCRRTPVGSVWEYSRNTICDLLLEMHMHDWGLNSLRYIYIYIVTHT